MKQLEISPAIKQTLDILTKQAGYVGIGMGSATGLPSTILAKFTFNDKGLSTDKMTGSFDFSTVTNERKIEWENANGQKQFSYILEGVTITTGEGQFQSSIPYEGYLQMQAAADNNAEFTLKQSSNKAGTTFYHAVRLIGIKSEVDTTADTNKAKQPATV